MTKKINWKILPDSPKDYYGGLPSNKEEKEIQKIRNYLLIGSGPDFKWVALYGITPRLRSTAIRFDLIVAYFLKRLGVPIFLSYISANPSISANQSISVQSLLNNVLDLIDKLGIRKTEIMLRPTKGV